MSTTEIHDVRNNGWGCAVYFERIVEGGRVAVSGCLTPLPQVGDAVRIRDDLVLRFTSVKPMGNPRDGFFGEMEEAETPAAVEGAR